MDESDRVQRIFRCVPETEIALAAPRTAVVEVKDVASFAPDGLRQVKVLLVSGKTMQQDDRRMRPCARGQVHDAVHQLARWFAATVEHRYVQLHHPRGNFAVSLLRRILD